MKADHAMIDLETMGTTPDSAIVSVGIVLFNPSIGVGKKTFYRELDWANQDRLIDKGTQAWWKTQSKEAKNALFGLDDLDDVLKEIAEFLPKDVKVWGNGPTFDISMLEDAYRKYDIEIPWKFWNIRDCRTIVDMFETKRGGFGGSIGGGSHNALEDARCEAVAIVKMWRNLILGK